MISKPRVVFNEELLLFQISDQGCAGIVLTEMQLEQEGVIKDLKIKRVCTGQGHYHVYFGIAHLQPGARGVLE